MFSKLETGEINQIFDHPGITSIFCRDPEWKRFMCLSTLHLEALAISEPLAASARACATTGRGSASALHAEEKFPPPTRCYRNRVNAGDPCPHRVDLPSRFAPDGSDKQFPCTSLEAGRDVARP